MAEEAPRDSTSKFKAAALAATAAAVMKSGRQDPEYLRGIAEIKRLADEHFKVREQDDADIEALKTKMAAMKEKSTVRKAEIEKVRNAREQEKKRIHDELEAQAAARAAEEEEIKKQIMNAATAGYDRTAAKNRRVKLWLS